MARIFGGITLAALVALSIACGGAGASSTVTTSSPGPHNSATVERPSIDSPPTDDASHKAADEASAPDPTEPEKPFDPLTIQVIDWIERGEPAMGQMKIGAIGRIDGLEVIQVLDASTMLCMVGSNFQVVMVRGYSTAGYVDGQRLSLPAAMVRGTEQYGNVLGSTKTVFTLVPVDDAAARDMLAEQELERIYRQEAEEEARIAETNRIAEEERESQFRTWHSADGNFSIEARLDRFIAGNVTLEKRDGSTVDVAEELLSDSDRQYMQEEFKRRAKAKRAIERLKAGGT